MVTPPKTSHGSGEYTFKEDLRLRHIAGRVKHLFYDWYDKRRYQPFFMCDTYNRENASFLPATTWLMSESSRCEICAEFKAGCVNKIR